MQLTVCADVSWFPLCWPADTLDTAIATSNKWSFVFDLWDSCLLPASMKLWQAGVLLILREQCQALHSSWHRDITLQQEWWERHTPERILSYFGSERRESVKSEINVLSLFNTLPPFQRHVCEYSQFLVFCCMNERKAWEVQMIMGLICIRKNLK